MAKQQTRVGIPSFEDVPEKCLSDSFAHVSNIHELAQKLEQGLQFFILGEVIKWQDWNSELWLSHERKSTVVDNGYVLGPSVYYPQVLGVEVLLQGAVLTVQSVREVFLVRVQVI